MGQLKMFWMQMGTKAQNRVVLRGIVGGNICSSMN